MKRLVVSMIVGMVLAGCGRHRTPPASPRGAAAAAKGAEATALAIADITNMARPTIVTAGGVFTNLVYDEADLSDSEDPLVSVCALERDAATNAKNPDIWYTLGRHYWDGGIDTSNAVACFEKARSLAPNALMPRLYIATTYASQMRYDDAARELGAALVLVHAEAEYARWASTVVSCGSGYKSERTDWMLNLLQPQAAGHAGVLRLIARIHKDNGNNADAAEAYLAALNATTTTALRIQVLQECAEMRNYPGMGRFASRLDEARSRIALPPFETLMIDVASTKEEEQDAKYPDLCRRAAAMTTNFAQRFEALKPLAILYAGRGNSAAVVREAVRAIVATDTPPASVAVQMAHWLVRAGASNDAIALLNVGLNVHTNAKDAIELSLALAGRAGSPDESALVALTNRFPNNALVFLRIAAFLDEHAWDAPAAEYRAIGVKLCAEPDVQARQAAALSAYYLRKGDVGAAKALLGQCGATLSNRAEGVASMAKLLLASGDTNGALAALLARCTNAMTDAEKELVFMPLVNTRWPARAMQEKAVEAAWRIADNLPMNTQSVRRQRFYDTLARESLLLNRTDDALRACGKVFAMGGYSEQFDAVCHAVNNPDRIESFVREIMRDADTQSLIYVRLGFVCQQADLPRLALELLAQNWNVSQQPWQRMRQLCRAIQLSHELKDYSQRDALLAALETEIGKGNVGNLYYMFRIFDLIGMQDRCGKLLQTALETAKEGAQYELFSYASQWYLDHGDTNALRALILKRFDPDKATPYEIANVVGMYRAIGDRVTADRLTAQFAAGITNAGAVSARGYALLNMMEQAGNKARMQQLVRDWIAMDDLGTDMKCSLAQQLSYAGDPRGARTIMETILASASPGDQRNNILNSLVDLCQRAGDYDGVKRYAQELAQAPNANMWSVYNAASVCFNAGMRQEAVLMLEQALDRANGNDNQYEMMNMRQNLIRFYLAMGDTASARQHAEQILDDNPLNPDAKEDEIEKLKLLIDKQIDHEKILEEKISP